MKPTLDEAYQRQRAATRLARAARVLRQYGQSALAEQVDLVSDGIYTGQITGRPVQ